MFSDPTIGSKIIKKGKKIKITKVRIVITSWEESSCDPKAAGGPHRSSGVPLKF